MIKLSVRRGPVQPTFKGIVFFLQEIVPSFHLLCTIHHVHKTENENQRREY